MCYVCHEIYALKVTFYHCHDDEEKCKFKRDLRLTESQRFDLLNQLLYSTWSLARKKLDTHF